MAGADIWAKFSADPREPASATLRATDADRDHAVEVLRDAFVEGQLTRAGLDQRSAAVLASRTLAELAGHLSDLVPVSTAPAVRAATAVANVHAEAVAKYQRDLRDSRNGWIMVTGICLAVWAATSAASGGLIFFWPIFPSLGVGIGYFMTRMQREERIEAHEKKLLKRRRKLG